MRKSLKSLLLFGATLLFAGCANDVESVSEGGLQKVTFTVSAEMPGTRAVADQDGQAANVNHWIMEVRDSDGDVYNRQEDMTDAGTLTHTFDVALIKGQTYNVLFWADNNGGYYNTADLTNVQLAGATTYAANLDARDAFSAVEPNFSATKAVSKTVELKRPFAQVNVIFTDLANLYATMGSQDEYAKFKPGTFVAKAKVPTSFNVQTQTAGAASATALEITAATDYLNNYDSHGAEETLFMDYVFATAGSKDVVDIDFSFVAKGVTVDHAFTAIPLQRNYRTNIRGDLMSANAHWTVEVVSTWADSEYNVPFYEASSVAQAQSYIAPQNADDNEAKVIKLAEDAVTASDVKADKVEDLKVVEFVLKTTSPNEVSFQLPEIPSGVADAWYVNYESGYTTEKVSVDAPEGTKVIINAPNSHVEVTGTSYAKIIAATNVNTLVIPAGCTVEMLVVKEGGLEIHGTVNAVAVELNQDKSLYVRDCEGLSQAVYDVLKDYVAEGYKAVQNGDAWDIVVDGEYWEYLAAECFSHIDASAKTIDIYSEAEFALLAKNVNSGTTYEGWTITLCKSLDMSGHKWTPVGNYTDDNPKQGVNRSFMGTFDGKNAEIKNLDVYSKDKKGCGVFGKVYAPCVLKNIKVVDAVVTAEGTNTYTGGLVGHGYGVIDNCSFKGTVTAGNQMGGIAASGGFTITNCTFDGTINGKYWAIGGIIGNCQDGGAISGNVAKGKIVGVLADCTDPFVGGGIIGSAIYTSYEVKDNYSDMTITFNGEPQTNYPVVGIYNIDAQTEDAKMFTNLTDKLGNNTWNRNIFTSDSYVITYVDNKGLSTGYMLNYGAATTKIAVATIGSTEYESLNAALAAVQDGETIVLGQVTDTPASVGAIANVSGKTFTIKGADKTKSILMCGNGTAGGEGACDYRLEGASVTFENLTFAQTSGDANYLGFVRPAKLTFDGCVFKGRTSYWGNDCTIKNSTFEHADSYDYCMWTWGCASMTITNTVFNTQGKAIKMYGNGTCVLNVEGCEFNSNGQHSGADKPAIAINTYYDNNVKYTTSHYTVNIKNCTQNGFVAGATGSALFGSDLASEVQGDLNVYVNDVQVWEDGAAVE